MDQPTALIIRTAGTNCDAELCRAFERAGATPDLVHVRRLMADPARIGGYDLIGFPGGFSYGDDVASEGDVAGMRADADFMFHLSIAQASANPYFATAMQALEDHIAVGMRFHGLSLRSTRGGLQHVFVEHTAVYEAIQAGDAEAARSHMRGHLIGSRDRLFQPSLPSAIA